MGIAKYVKEILEQDVVNEVFCPLTGKKSRAKTILYVGMPIAVMLILKRKVQQVTSDTAVHQN